MHAVIHFVAIASKFLHEAIYFRILPVLDCDAGHGALLEYAFMAFD
jgi:hypothetical protein